MNVIYSIGSHLGTSGISNTAYRAVKEIEKEGILKRLICLDYKSNDLNISDVKSFKLFKYSIWFPLKGIQRYIIHSYNPYIFLDKLYDRLASLYVTKSDIFHYWRGHGSLSSIKAKRLGSKIFVENASSHPEVQNELLMREYKKYGIKTPLFTEERIREAVKELKDADYIVVPRGFAYNSFIKKGFNKNKLVPVNFGIDLNKFKTFRKIKKDEKFRAIFVGQVTLRKGIQYLLKAWDELNLANAELVIVGQINGDAQKIVDSYKDNESIKFMGQTNPLPHYAKSDIFVFPSIEEGSALVTYEAMACGLPQISTYNSGTVARDGKEGFIVPICDSNSIKEKIKYFYNNPEKIKKMSRNSLNHVKNYSWENYGKKIIKAYKKSFLTKVKLSTSL